jgi:type II secretory pathway pseudopilin PulG
MRTHSRLLGSTRAGSALVLSLMAVLVVSILAAGFLQLATSIGRRIHSSSDTLHAFQIAEAGLAEAYTGMGAAHTGNVGTPDVPAFFGGGLFWTEVTQAVGGMAEIRCTAMYGTGRATLGLVCEPVEIGVGGLGFFTKDDLKVNPDVRLDSYDSQQGSYTSQINSSLNNQGIIGSNGNVTLSSGNLIFGDVVHGPTSKASIPAGATVTGDVTPRPELEVLPPVDVPNIALGPPKNYTSATPLVIAPGDAGYKSLSIGKNTKAVLKGPLNLVVGDLKLASGGNLEFNTADGPVHVFVTNSVDLATGSLVSTSTNVTSDSLVMVSAPMGKTVKFGSKAQFYGFIYAPDAEVHIASTYEIYGGVSVKRLNLSAQGKMHYDLALGPTLESQLPVLQAWRVVDMPAPLAANRMDPFRVLGLDPSALPSPAAAHEDQVLDIRYRDENGTLLTYLGLESAFDWSLVTEVIYGARDGLAFLLPDDYYQQPVVANDPLRDFLLAAPNVSAEALIAACERNPPMNSSDLASVLQNKAPLAHDVLLSAIGSDSLTSSALTNVLKAASPLAPDLMAAVLQRQPALSASDLTNLLKLQ